MRFDPERYGSEAARILALDGSGERLMPLAKGTCSSAEARRQIHGKTPRQIFPDATHPEAALGGLWLYFSCLDESHTTAQDIPSSEGSFWHAIMHRQEPDAGNSGYWFRRVGKHPVFGQLRDEAAAILETHPEAAFSVGESWDPYAFIDFCESARRRPGSEDEAAALEIQRAEWQLLFDHCARPR